MQPITYKSLLAMYDSTHTASTAQHHTRQAGVLLQKISTWDKASCKAHLLAGCD